MFLSASATSEMTAPKSAAQARVSSPGLGFRIGFRFGFGFGFGLRFGLRVGLGLRVKG